MPKCHKPEITKPEPSQPSPFDQGDRLLNVKQVAEITGLAVDTLNRARIYGADAPPFLKIGKACRYRLSTVQRWIENHREFQSTSARQAAVA